MRRSIVSLSAGIILCLCAIALSTSLLRASIPESAKALAALDDEWSKAAAAGNVDGVVSYYADDATAYPPNAPAATGKAAIKAAWQALLGNPKIKLAWKATNAGVDHNMGFTTGTYQVTSSGMIVEKGKYVCVWRKGADGKWKALHDIWNSNSK